MILGSVNPSGEAIVPLQVRGPRGAKAEFQAVVDTGYNDWLAIPRTAIEALGLPFREEGRYVLADGVEVHTLIFAAEAQWFGRWRPILVGEMEGGPLLGMALLRGYFLGVEVIDGGRVDIRPLAG